MEREDALIESRICLSVLMMSSIPLSSGTRSGVVTIAAICPQSRDSVNGFDD